MSEALAAPAAAERPARERCRLYLQRPPRVQWALTLTRYEEQGSAQVRTWFGEDEYGPGEQPPQCVVAPLLETMSRVAEAALAASPPGQRAFTLVVWEREIGQQV